jgi:hypothetical protein
VRTLLEFVAWVVLVWEEKELAGEALERAAASGYLAAQLGALSRAVRSIQSDVSEPLKAIETVGVWVGRHQCHRNGGWVGGWGGINAIETVGGWVIKARQAHSQAPSYEALASHTHPAHPRTHPPVPTPHTHIHPRAHTSTHQHPYPAPTYP